MKNRSSFHQRLDHSSLYVFSTSSHSTVPYLAVPLLAQLCKLSFTYFFGGTLHTYLPHSFLPLQCFSLFLSLPQTWSATKIQVSKQKMASRYRIRIWTLNWCWWDVNLQAVSGNTRKMFFSFSYTRTFSHLLKKVLVTSWPSVWIVLLQSFIRNSLEGMHGLNKSER